MGKMVGQSVHAERNSVELDMDELTVILLSWLYDAVMWRGLYTASSPEDTDASTSRDDDRTCTHRNFRTAMLVEANSLSGYESPTSPSAEVFKRFSRTALLPLDADTSMLSCGQDLTSASPHGGPKRFSRTAMLLPDELDVLTQEVGQRSPAPPARSSSSPTSLRHLHPPSPQTTSPQAPMASPPHLDVQIDNDEDTTGKGHIASCSSTLAGLLSARSDSSQGSWASSRRADFLREFLLPSPHGKPATDQTLEPADDTAPSSDCNNTNTKSENMRTAMLPAAGSALDEASLHSSKEAAGIDAEPSKPASPSKPQNLRTALICAETKETASNVSEPSTPASPSKPHNLRTALICEETQELRKLQPEPVGLQVLVHIYDVSQEQTIQRINRILAHRLSPLKLGGVFHCGVEVDGMEWSFGLTDSADDPGVTSVEPTTHPAHHFRQTIRRGCTSFSAEGVASVISAMAAEYPGPGYDLLRRNCCHFAADLCQRLGVEPIPGWVHRLARIGARIDNVLKVQKRILARENSRYRDNGIVRAPSCVDSNTSSGLS